MRGWSLKPSRWGLRGQMMGLLALAAVCPTVLLGALAIDSARRDVRDEVIRGNLALIRSVGQQLNTTLQDTRRALLVAAAAWSEDPAQAKQVLRRLRDEFSLLRTVTLLDREGQTIGGNPLDPGVDFSLDLAHSYGGYVSDVLFGPGTRRVLLVVQARDRRGALAGFLAALVDLGFVGERLAETRLGSGASLLLVDGHGRRVAAAGPQPATRAADDRSLRGEHPGVDRALATHTEGHLIFTDSAARRWIAVYRNLSLMSEFRGVRWSVVLQQPTARAFALARKATRDTLLVAGFVLLVALGTGAAVAGRITRPLGRLVDQTQQVAAGRLDASLPSAPAGAEIARLSRSFAQMVENLRQGRDRLYALTEFRRNLVESIPVGVLSLDRDGVIRAVNAAQQRLSGRSAAELLDRPLTEAFPERPDDLPLGARLRQLLSSGEPIDLTLDNKPTAFTPHPSLRYRIRGAPLRDRQGQIDGAVVLQEDLSERARLEQQLLRSEKLSSVGVLAAGVAHEINNPLTTILGYAKLLLEGREPEDPDHAALSLIADEARRVQIIVRELLDFSRAERGQMQSVAIEALIERTLTLVAPDLRKRGVQIERRFAPDLPLIEVEQTRIEQVFVNLVTNAAQAMPEGGLLCIETGADDRWVVARFVDQGPGIPAENIARIFDPFFTTKGPSEGTGLGLAVSHNIIARHGGQIEVASEEGQGSTFCVRLPRA